MTRLDGVTFVNAPGLCEAPFPFTVVTLDGDRVTSARHELAMPKELRLIDGHLHTQLAYCSDNMTVERAIAMADACGLAGLAFTEHSGHLYFPASRYWNQGCFADGMAGADPADRRMDAYFDLKRQFESSTVRFGLEVDIDYRGELLLAEADRPHFDYLVGAVHYLPNLSREAPPTPRDHDEFLFLSEKLMTSGMAVLAHPFRVYRRSGWPAPEELFLPLARLLRKYGVAAEINYHTNEPPAEFFRVCLAEGVRISFASDAHHLGEVGDFAPHLALLKEAGFDGELADILVSPTAV